MNITALNNQSLFDIAIQEFGSADAAFDIALANDISITQTLETGRVLQLPTAIERFNRPIADYYKNRRLSPATASDTNNLPTGIGFWTIDINFIIL
ncbi:MAG: LysM domain-containing protein [Prevotellaceae bacterium]|jgi:hypothetical protein|nr:LysM domain-containing protein [Prevotellaceae bacterium]